MWPIKPVDIRRIRVQDPSQSPLPFSLANKPVFWTEPWDNSLLPLCLDACTTESKCAVTNTEINNLFSHKGGSRSSNFSFEILTSFGLWNKCPEIKSIMPWNKINRKLSHLACTQHLQLKHVSSGFSIPATTPAMRECGGQDRLESAAVIVEDIISLKSQTQKHKWHQYVCKTLGSASKLLWDILICSRDILLWLWVRFQSAQN